MGRSTARAEPATERRHPVRELREHLGLSLADFCREIGRSPPTISVVENRVRATGLGASSALAILDVDRYRGAMLELGLDLEDLLRGDRAHRRDALGRLGRPA